MAARFKIQIDLDNPDHAMVAELLDVVDKHLGEEPVVADYIRIMTTLGQVIAVMWMRTDFEGRAMIPFLRGLVDQASEAHNAMTRTDTDEDPAPDVGHMEPEGRG